MAYELIDSTQLDDNLTLVANAIRTAGGTSGSLAFPAGFINAIGDIGGGGGGGGDIPNGVEIGVFEPTEEVFTYTVSHSLNSVPSMAFAMALIGGNYSSVQVSVSNYIIYNQLFANPLTHEFDISDDATLRRNVCTMYDTANNRFANSDTYTTYPASMSNSQVTFANGRYYGAKFAKIKYMYVIIK